MTIATNSTILARHDAGISSSPCVAEIDESFRLHQHSAYGRWLELFQSDRAASIAHHPDYLFHDLNALEEFRDGTGYFLTDAHDHEASWGAGLVPKIVTLSRFVGCGTKPVIRGYRLIGDRPFGNGSTDTLSQFWNAIEKFLVDINADFLLIEDHIEPSPLAEILASRQADGFREVLLLPRTTRYGIRLTNDPDEYWSSFSRNSRKQNRKILADTQAYRLWRVTEVSEIPEFLHAVQTVTANSWQHHRLREYVAAEEALLERLVFLAENGALRSYVLYDGTHPITFEIDIQYNGELISETTAYDMRYADRGPGRALQLRVIEDLFAYNCPARYDFGSGHWEYKRRFSNEYRTSSKVWLVKRNLRFNFLARMIAFERQCRGLARTAIDRMRRKQ